MRGRTNISNRINSSSENININANIEAYEVYKDENIIEGYMVDFITEKKTGKINVSNISTTYKEEIRKYIFKLSDGRYACFLSANYAGSLYILSKGSEQLTINLSNNTIGYFYKIIELCQDTFLLFASPIDVNGKWNIQCTFLNFNINTNAISSQKIKIETNINKSSSKDFIDYVIKKVDHFLYIMMNFTGNDKGGTAFTRYIKVTYSGDKIGNFKIIKDIEKEVFYYAASPTGYPWASITDFFVINDIIYAFYSSRSNIATKYEYHWNEKKYVNGMIIIDGSNVSSSFEFINRSGLAWGLFAIPYKQIFKVFFVYENNMYTMMIDCTNATVTSFQPVISNYSNITNLFEINGVIDNMRIFPMYNSEKKFLLTLDNRISDEICIIEIEDDNIIAYKKKTYDVITPQVFFDNENNFMYLDVLDSGSVMLTHFIIENDIITGGDNTNETYVKNASSLQYIKGIAKESGTAGQIIDVYIPKI